MGMQLTPLDPVLISAAGITARHRRSARPAHSCVRDHCRTVRRWRLDCAKPRKNGDQTRRLAMLILVSSQRQCRRAQGQDGAAPAVTPDGRNLWVCGAAAGTITPITADAGKPGILVRASSPLEQGMPISKPSNRHLMAVCCTSRTWRTTPSLS